MKSTFVIAVILGIFGGAVSARAANPLPSYLHDIAGIEETLPVDDLLPVGRSIGDASVVALGESVHSSKGYYQAKFRLIRYLVEHLGFRAVTVEAMRGYSARTSRYVATCEGTPQEAMEGLYFPNWFDSSVREMLQWLCEYNRAHPADPVTFHGFDMQEPRFQRTQITEYFRTAAPADADPLLSGISGCVSMTADGQKPLPEGHEPCLEGMKNIQRYFTRHKAELIAASSLESYELARLTARNIGHFQEQYHFRVSNRTRSYQARDEGMADSFLTLRRLYFPGKKAIVWAHNVHVALNWEAALPVTEGYLGASTMGSFIRKRLRGGYYVLGLTGYNVGISACQEKVGGSLPAPSKSPRSLEFHLSSFKRPFLFADLARARAPFSRLMDHVAHTWQQQIVPKEQYSGVLFLQDSAPADAWTDCD